MISKENIAISIFEEKLSYRKLDVFKLLKGTSWINSTSSSLTAILMYLL
jgi:hypothetical protein